MKKCSSTLTHAPFMVLPLSLSNIDCISLRRNLAVISVILGFSGNYGLWSSNSNYGEDVIVGVLDTRTSRSIRVSLIQVSVPLLQHVKVDRTRFSCFSKVAFLAIGIRFLPLKLVK
ncbi:hypothetical protein AALP_AA6G294900 [Arabis alpina]|uniref:Uncharacterized protein n=1 Tax=Arabis alpina TaxID=50452 RepID=A0A087GSJ6_ARAAL|nr:hypothetical protein AALP_AA6G294900 [Arabis alpina]